MDSKSSNAKFDLVLDELLTLQQEDERKKTSFNRVLKELVRQRERAAMVEERNQMMEKMAQQQTAMLSEFKKEIKEQNREAKREREEIQAERREAQARLERERNEAQARQERYIEKILDVVDQQKEELSFFKERGGGEFTPIITPQMQGGNQKIVSKLLDQHEEMKNQQELLIRVVERQKEEIHTLKNGSDAKTKPISDSDDARVRDFKLSPQPPKTKPTMNDISEFDSLPEIEEVEEDLEVRQLLFLEADKDQTSLVEASFDRNVAEEIDRGKNLQDLVESEGNRGQELDSSEGDTDKTSQSIRRKRKRKDEKLAVLAEELFFLRTNNAVSNQAVVQKFFEKHSDVFEPILKQCPCLDVLIANMLVLRLGFRIQEVDWSKGTRDWDKTDCRRVGRAFAAVMRVCQTGANTLDSWAKHYPQLTIFFEIDGFRSFMLVLADELLLANHYGMIFRVAVGALISIFDGGTDIYVLTTYYKNDLVGPAHTLLLLLSMNVIVQLVVVVIQNKKKSVAEKLKEAIITILLLRPIVDAYRLSAAKTDDNSIFDPLAEMLFNKAIELSTESIPGCVLQLIVYLEHGGSKSGTYALVSILVSALVTGYISSMISFDMDTDANRRKMYSNFYGYIPDDNDKRRRVFLLMMGISTLHNLNRSVGCAMLALTKTGNLLVFFLVGEMGLYLFFKVVRDEFFYFVEIGGPIKFVVALVERVLGKIIVDFSGCLHMRAGAELGGLAHFITVVYSQIFPFLALHLFDGDEVTRNKVNFFLVGSISLWAALNFALFATIDLSYIRTFFEIKTQNQHWHSTFVLNESEQGKFSIFAAREAIRKQFKDEIKSWVDQRIDNWMEERPSWFDLVKVPEEYLPERILKATGGEYRRRKSSITASFRETVDDLKQSKRASLHRDQALSVREILHDEESSSNPAAAKRKTTQHLQASLRRSFALSYRDGGAWKSLGEELYAVRSNNHKSNMVSAGESERGGPVRAT